MNSLFVSRQQTPLQGQRDRIDAVHGFRADLEALIDASVTPTEADDLLGALTSAIVAASSDSTTRSRTGKPTYARRWNSTSRTPPTGPRRRTTA